MRYRKILKDNIEESEITSMLDDIENRISNACDELKESISQPMDIAPIDIIEDVIKMLDSLVSDLY